MTLLSDGVVPAGRPFAPKARVSAREPVLQIGPPPSSPRLRRIRGLVSLRYQGQSETIQGRGAGTTAYSTEAVMDKFDPCGIEVSAQELVVALSRDGRAERVRSIQRALARLTREAQRILEQDPLLNSSYHLLLTAKGIGPTSALRLLAETALLSEDLDVRQWVAYAGLDPREYQSGSSVHKKVRISKTGNRHLRRALYMPALVAVRHEPHLRAFYQHLLAQGKCKMQALVAAMRKLLHAVYGMLKHRQPYDGAKLYRLAENLYAPSSGHCSAEAA